MIIKKNGLRNQRTDVLNYLRTHSSISQMEAYRVFSAPITRLSAVIYDLRKAGCVIDSEDCSGSNCYGKYTYTKYSLVVDNENL